MLMLFATVRNSKTELTELLLGDNFDKEHDLLKAIKIPFDDPKTMYFDQGLDGFPAFGIMPGSDIKSPYRLTLPERFYPEFSVVCTVAVKSAPGGFIFAVLNPSETNTNVKLAPDKTLIFQDSSPLKNEDSGDTDLKTFKPPTPLKIFKINYINNEDRTVQLGLQTLLLDQSRMNISLFYTDVTKSAASQIIASFVVPYSVGRFGKIGIQVTGDEATLYFNCKKIETVNAKRHTEELRFDPASTLYIGQAGPIMKGNLDGSLQEVRVYGSMLETAEMLCDSFKPFPTDYYGDEATTDHTMTPDETESSGESDLPGTVNSKVENKGGLPPPPVPPLPPLAGLAVKGEKGDKGDRGLPGESVHGVMGMTGPSGPIGPPGPPGPPGLACTTSGTESTTLCDKTAVVPIGSCSCNLTEMMITANVTTLVGPSGPKGDEGRPGPPGDRGLPGERGDPGMNGEKGSQGDPGEAGKEGLPGDKGQPGIDGKPGLRGPEGPQGPPGPPGTPEPCNHAECNGQPGPIGPKGEPGKDGLPGTQGNRGLPGNKGDRGHKGERGQKGDKGIQGATGRQGFKGESGPRGADGLLGPKGRTGDRGERGEKGDIGPAGPSTNPDEVKKIISEYLTEIENTGWKLKGEKGDRGEIGLPGVQGEKGERGQSDLGGQISLNSAGRDKEILRRDSRGDMKNSAKRKLVKGDKGDKGDPGKDGRPGDQVVIPGPAGPPGPPGPPGALGSKGMPGLSIQGEKGEPGPPGIVYGSSAVSPSVPGIITYENKEALLEASSLHTAGTIAYLIDEEVLLVRVNRGWTYIQMGSTIHFTVKAPEVPTPPTLSQSSLSPPPTPSVPSQINKRDGRSLRVAALNEPYSGNMLGWSGAESKCYYEGKRLGISTFKPVLVARNINLEYLVIRDKERDWPVYNLRDELLFKSWRSLFTEDGGIIGGDRPPIYSFNGKDVRTDPTWSEKYIWLGATERGFLDTDSSCDLWSSNSDRKMGAVSSLGANKLLSIEKLPCNRKLIVLCVEGMAYMSVPRRRRRRHEDLRYRNTTADLNAEFDQSIYDY